MTGVHQVVFGYDDGHRLLAGSIKLLADTQALLLATTDADPGDDQAHIVTGLPLPAEKLYALCFTWRAPELPRPGAVWAHVLLISAEQLREFESPYTYATLARRPSRVNLSSFQDPLTAKPDIFRSYRYNNLLKISDLVLRHNSGTIRASELTEAAEAFGFMWGLQWPALRSRFRFRTRHVARPTTGRQVYQVARKAEGAITSTSPAMVGDSVRHSIETTAWELLNHEENLREFMFAFGPKHPATRAAFSSLYDIYWALESGDAQRCCLLIQEAFPDPLQAADLKMSLLGAQANHFTDHEVVRCLLASSFDAWDLDALSFPRRLGEVLQIQGAVATLRCLASPAAPMIADVVANVLRRTGTLHEILWVAEYRVDLLAQVLSGDVRASKSAKAWRDLSVQDARHLLGILPLSTALALAVINGRQGPALISTHGHARILHLMRQDHPEAAGLVLDEVPPSPQDTASWDAETLIFAAGCRAELIETDGTAQRLEIALEWHRDQVTSPWLQAAASLLALGGSVADHSLTTTFGPLHLALTENRLPAEAWRTVDAVLPPGRDTSSRLRDHLLRVAQYRDWSTHDLSSALRDAGPYAREDYWPKRGTGERLAKHLRAALKDLGMASK